MPDVSLAPEPDVKELEVIAVLVPAGAPGMTAEPLGTTRENRRLAGRQAGRDEPALATAAAGARLAGRA